MSIWKTIDEALERIVNALAFVACCIVVCIFVMIVIDVSIRTLGYTPPGFTLAVVEYSLLYFAMFSAPYLVRNRGHVTIEAVVAILPKPVQRPLAKLVYLACSVVAAMFCYYSFLLEVEAIQTLEIDLRGIDIPYYLLFIPMPIGFALVSVEFLRYLFGPYSWYTYDLGEIKDSV